MRSQGDRHGAGPGRERDSADSEPTAAGPRPPVTLIAWGLPVTVPSAQMWRPRVTREKRSPGWDSEGWRGGGGWGAGPEPKSQGVRGPDLRRSRRPAYCRQNPSPSTQKRQRSVSFHWLLIERERAHWTPWAGAGACLPLPHRELIAGPRPIPRASVF